MKDKERIVVYDSLMGLLGAAILILAIVMIFIFKCKRKRITIDQLSQDQGESPAPSYSSKASATSYSLANIDAATDGFNRRRVIGSGRLGTLYAAVSEKGELVAVKRIHSRLVLSNHNAGFGFSTILKSLSQAQHQNIVPIIGFSEAPGERILVMEFAGTITLDFLLHQNEAAVLGWAQRVRIAAGAARGLEYLHEGMAPGVVHGCVKPSNVVVDANFVARVCDYGLGFLAPKERQGLVGYVDEEYWLRPGPCKESDVYGLGVVFMEILSGRKCGDGILVKWGLPLIRANRLSEFLDQRLVFDDDVVFRVLARLAKVASACVGNSRKSRPSVAQVAAILTCLEFQLCL